MCNLHWCYTFCTGITLFALVLHLNCTALSQSESSNFFMYIIMQVTVNSHSFCNVGCSWHLAVNSFIIGCHVAMNYPMNAVTGKTPAK